MHFMETERPGEVDTMIKIHKTFELRCLESRREPPVCLPAPSLNGKGEKRNRYIDFSYIF